MESENSFAHLSGDSSLDSDEWSIILSENSSISSCSSNNCSIEIEQPRFMVRTRTSDFVLSQMNADIDPISESLQLSPTIVRSLFEHYRWNKLVLMEKYVACDCDKDREAFFRDARIINPLNYTAYTSGHVTTTTATCEKCYDTRVITVLQCGHKFCDSCWRIYLTSRINYVVDSIIPCAHPKCDMILEDVTVKTFVTDPKVISKYNRLICNSFVQWKKNLHWCPSPQCMYIIEIPTYDDCKYVTCLCKNQFCCECYSEWHAPISCKLLKQWKSEDLATLDYLSLVTKSCPKCLSWIENNGDAPYMKCINCKHDFCWECLKTWEEHESYKCKIPTAEENQKSRSLIERKKIYSDHYSYNSHALQQERKRYDLNRQEIPDLFDVIENVNILYECRRFLMYSYAYIFYLEKDDRAYLLESNLDDLEAKTEKLNVSLKLFLMPNEHSVPLTNEDSVPMTNEDSTPLPNDDSVPMPNRGEQLFKLLNHAVHCDILRKHLLSDIEKQCEEDSRE